MPNSLSRSGRMFPFSAMPESVTVAASFPMTNASSYRTSSDKFTRPSYWPLLATGARLLAPARPCEQLTRGVGAGRQFGAGRVHLGVIVSALCGPPIAIWAWRLLGHSWRSGHMSTTVAYASTMRRSVTSQGHTISYRTDGDGAPLVLLCGWSRWADTWWDAGYVDGLGEGYRVIAVDRLGHGESDKPHDPARYLEHLIVSDIVSVLDAEEVERALVWGFSMGARNAASLAVFEPTRVAALVCGGGRPVPTLDGRRDRALQLAELSKSADGLTLLLRSIGMTDEGIVESLSRNDLAALSANQAGSAEWFPEANEVHAPSLWYVGGDDEGGFTSEELELTERLGVETHVLPGAAHASSFSQSDAVLPIVRPFLGRHRH